MTELPRVLLCSFEVVPGPSGAAQRLTDCLDAVAPHFQAVALTLKTSELTHIEAYHGARLFRVPLTGDDFDARLQTFARAVRRQLESEEYALVHFTDPFGGQVLCEERAQRGYRLVYDLARFPSVEPPNDIGEQDHASRVLSRLRRQELFCLMNADAVVVGSTTTRGYLETIGVPPNTTHLIRTPAHAGPAHRAPSTEPGLRLLYVGSLDPWQGLETLLEGVAMARARGPGVQLRIVGPDHPTQGARLRGKIDALGLPGEVVRIEPPVRKDQLAALVSEADLGALPLALGERNEVRGAPLSKLTDYLSAGRGVIAADVPAARSMAPDGATVFFPPENPAGLAEVLVQLAADPARRTELGIRARAFADEKLTVPAFRNSLRRLYCALLGIRDPRAEPSGTDDDTQVADVGGPTLQRKRPDPDEYTVLEESDED